MREFTTKSGANVVIFFAGFKQASSLKNAVSRELLKINIDLGKLNKETIGSLLESDVTPEFLNSCKNVLLILDSSETVEKALFDCLIRCTYNGEKITRDTFEDFEAVSDYYEIAFNCLKDNLFPFFKNQISLLGILKKAKNSDIQK